MNIWPSFQLEVRKWLEKGPRSISMAYLGLATVILVGVVSVLWWILFPSKYRQWVDKIPGPKPIPLLGNAHQFERNAHGGFRTEILPVDISKVVDILHWYNSFRFSTSYPQKVDSRYIGINYKQRPIYLEPKKFGMLTFLTLLKKQGRN